MSENGTDYTSGHLYAKEDANEDKNHNYSSDPRVNLSDPQPGMILADSAGRFYMVLAGPTFKEIHQGGEIICYQADVITYENEVVYNTE